MHNCKLILKPCWLNNPPTCNSHVAAWNTHVAACKLPSCHHSYILSPQLHLVATATSCYHTMHLVFSSNNNPENTTFHHTAYSLHTLTLSLRALYQSSADLPRPSALSTVFFNTAHSITTCFYLSTLFLLAPQALASVDPRRRVDPCCYTAQFQSNILAQQHICPVTVLYVDFPSKTCACYLGTLQNGTLKRCIEKVGTVGMGNNVRAVL